MTKLPSSREECRQVDRVGESPLNNSNTNTHVPVVNRQKKAVGRFVLFLTRVKGRKEKKGMNEWLLGYRNKDKGVKS